jgi:glycosyltransferase involved in cell wall biosynthesis
MKDHNKITAIMVVYHEEDIIREALKSIAGVVDEILILHDGPCSDKTLDIAREYTDAVYENTTNAGVPGMILPQLFRRVKTPWILKIDADERLSDEMRDNIRKLVSRDDAPGYTFIWPFVDSTHRPLTKGWPRKMALYRKDKMSYFGFPHWDDPHIDGHIVDTPYIFHHHPRGGSLPTWKDFKKKTLGRYARLHAEYTLKPFDSFDSFQYTKTEFPPHFKIRLKYPLLSAIPIAVLAFFKTLFSEGAWKEGYPAFNESAQSLLYYPYVGWLVYILKRKQSDKEVRGLS